MSIASIMGSNAVKTAVNFVKKKPLLVAGGACAAPLILRLQLPVKNK